MYPQIDYNCCLFLAHGKNLTAKSTQTTVVFECKSGNAISKLSVLCLPAFTLVTITWCLYFCRTTSLNWKIFWWGSTVILYMLFRLFYVVYKVYFTWLYNLRTSFQTVSQSLHHILSNITGGLYIQITTRRLTTHLLVVNCLYKIYCLAIKDAFKAS